MGISVKRSKLMTGAEKIQGNDDLLTEILILLPPKSIFKCKCVSKRWSSIIAHPLFRQSYCTRTSKQQLSGAGGRLLAFVQEKSWDCHDVLSSRPFQNILPIVQQDEPKIKPLPDSFGTIVHSSDGLFLCEGRRSIYGPCQYRVVNPLTRQWVQFWICHGVDGTGLACIENTEELIPNFKVVGIMTGEGNWYVDTFFYETRGRTRSPLVVTEEAKEVTTVYLKLVYRGVFHWETDLSSIAVYNSNRHENCVVLIKLPTRNAHLTATRSSTDDLLWIATGLGRSSVDGSELKFWKLPIDDYDSYKCATTITEDQWVLMHTIKRNPLLNELSLVLESKKRKIKEAAAGSIRDIKMEALIPSNPVTAVLNLQQNIFLYNLESQSLELVKYRGRPYGDRLIKGWLPFIESRSLSSYGPF